MTAPVKKKRGRKPKPKVENKVPKVKKKRGRKPKPKVENEVPKVKKKRGRKKKCDIDALNKITGYSNVGESIDMVDNKINFSECDNNLDENLPSQKISFGNLSIIVQNAKKDDPKEIQKKFYANDDVDNQSHIIQEKKQICSLNFSDSEEESDSEDENETVVKKFRLPKRVNKDIKFIGIMKHYKSINDSKGKDVIKKLIYCVGIVVILLKLNLYFYQYKKIRTDTKYVETFVVGVVLKLILRGVAKVNIIIYYKHILKILLVKLL